MFEREKINNIQHRKSKQTNKDRKKTEPYKMKVMI